MSLLNKNDHSSGHGSIGRVFSAKSDVANTTQGQRSMCINTREKSKIQYLTS